MVKLFDSLDKSFDVEAEVPTAFDRLGIDDPGNVSRLAREKKRLI